MNEHGKELNQSDTSQSFEDGIISSEDETAIEDDDSGAEDETVVEDDDSDSEDETTIEDDDSGSEDETTIEDDDSSSEDETTIEGDVSDSEDKVISSEDKAAIDVPVIEEEGDDDDDLVGHTKRQTSKEPKLDREDSIHQGNHHLNNDKPRRRNSGQAKHPHPSKNLDPAEKASEHYQLQNSDEAFNAITNWKVNAEKRQADTMRHASGGSGYFENAQNVTNNYNNNIVPHYGHLPQQQVVRRTINMSWSELPDVDRSQTENASALVNETSRTYKAAKNKLDRNEFPILLVTSTDADYLNIIAHALSFEIGVTFKQLGVLEQTLLEDLCTLDKAVKEPEENAEPIPKEQLPDSRWYLSINQSAYTLRYIDSKLLNSVISILRDRNMGLLIAINTAREQVPALWHPYMIHFDRVDPYKQINTLLGRSKKLPDQKQLQAAYNLIEKNKIVREYLEMNLSYRDIQALAADVLDIVSKDTDTTIQMLDERRSQRLSGMLSDWIHEYIVERNDFSKLSQLIALAALNRAEMNHVLQAADALDGMFDHSLPEITQDVDLLATETLNRQEAIQAHPFMQRRSTRLDELMAVTDEETRRFPSGERKIEVVRFRYDNYDLFVLEYIWREYTNIHNQLAKWLLALLQSDVNYIVERAARTLGLLVNDTMFVEIEQRFIDAMIQEKLEHFTIKEMSLIIDAVLQEKTLSDHEKAERESAEQERRTWLDMAARIEEIFWWAYDPTNMPVASYIQQKLTQWANIKGGKDDVRIRLYLAIALTGYQRIGVYFPEQSVKDIDYIVRVRRLREKKVDMAFIRTYERKNNINRSSPVDLDEIPSIPALPKLDKSQLTKRGAQRGNQDDRQKKDSKKSYNAQKKNLKYNKVTLPKRRREEQLFLYEAMVNSISIMFGEATRILSEKEQGLDISDAVHKSVRKTIHMLLDCILNWVSNSKNDGMTAGIGLNVLRNITEFRVRYVLSSRDEYKHYKRWGLLTYLARKDEKVLIKLGNILRNMWFQRTTSLRKTAEHIFYMVLQQVSLSEGDTAEQIRKRETYVFAYKLFWQIAFGKDAENHQGVEFLSHIQALPYDLKQGSDGTRFIWQLLGEDLAPKK